MFRWGIWQEVQLLKQVFNRLAYIDVLLRWNFIIPQKTKIFSEFMRFNWLKLPLLIEVHLVGNKDFHDWGAENLLNSFVPIRNFVEWFPIWDVQHKYDTICLLLNRLGEHVGSVSLVPKMRFDWAWAKGQLVITANSVRTLKWFTSFLCFGLFVFVHRGTMHLL